MWDAKLFLQGRQEWGWKFSVWCLSGSCKKLRNGSEDRSLIPSEQQVDPLLTTKAAKSRAFSYLHAAQLCIVLSIHCVQDSMPSFVRCNNLLLASSALHVAGCSQLACQKAVCQIATKPREAWLYLKASLCITHSIFFSFSDCNNGVDPPVQGHHTASASVGAAWSSQSVTQRCH